MDVMALARFEVVADDGARLAVATAGAADRARPLAVLQHGFPDTPMTWRHLAPVLVDRGYRVAMPWLRGYLPSTTGTDRITVGRYAKDLAAVHAALGGDDRAVLVGHDWGSVAAWDAAGRCPWRAVVGLAVPPEPALRGFLTDLDQLWRSRYQLWAQLPLAGWLVRQDLRPLVDLWLRWSPGHVPTAADLEPLRRALATRTAVAAALAPYRASRRAALTGRFPREDGPVPAQPAMVVHGRRDQCIHERYALAARGLLVDAAPPSTVWLVDGAGHFAHLERPELVNDAIVSFLSRA